MSEFCALSEPIKPSVADHLTDGTKRQIVAHNEVYERRCENG